MLSSLPKDIVILVSSENAITERRISPSWTLSTLKSRLEPITGIPPFAQQLSYQLHDASPAQPISTDNEDGVHVSDLGWTAGAKLVVSDTRPPGLRENYTDTSQVEKYEMPEEDYAKLSDSVLAWKKRNQLGRFDPNQATTAEQKQAEDEKETEEKGIKVGARCIVGEVETGRRGEVAYVGLVEKIPQGGIWVGVKLDEPTGKNDGSIDGVRFFEAGSNRGTFVRPNRVTVGDFPPKSLDDEDLLEEM
ncbi:hypothetical protein TWF569_008359 [Orbilia oligospora]|uniref:CAP-Gly domain-containing protein n=1 Tax=Orbilia oligospora TaxID=2813651 RepID=A0A7C8J9I2_ORBOL|nr:hypothetical protein TWF103_002098 [Orbilia oligospora]KAF3088717.1 hypothetical protein TWF102_010089 [Orbilia oligospora]KAF3106787.1 hypothetical protein TWF706_003281 [Orbilia oligospora]KAF3119684.1 hypothetical protein TWF703_003235 [Orbilia oligospora]KAF3122628.1 hypothetical protein TWF594_002781 [Orbilia oligospora]